MVFNSDRSANFSGIINTDADIVFNRASTQVSLTNMNTRLTTLETSGVGGGSGGTFTLNNYSSEQDAYFNEGIGGQYLLNQNRESVGSHYFPSYTFGYNSALRLSGTTYTEYTNMSTAQSWTAEAFIRPVWVGTGLSGAIEWYFFDSRSTDTGGFALGIIIPPDCFWVFLLH